MARADVAVAFISRRQMTLPAPYLQTLVEHDQGGKWSFFAFKSCPVIFVLAMSQLSRLAGLYKRAASMGWTVFDEQTFVPELARIRRMVEDERVDLARNIIENGHPNRSRLTLSTGLTLLEIILKCVVKLRCAVRHTKRVYPSTCWPSF